MAMLYGNTPKIDVTREYNDPDDDVARVSAMLFERMLTGVNVPSGKGVESVLNGCLQDRLVPGMGIARIRYEIDTEMVQSMDEQFNAIEVEKVIDERAPIDYVHWQDVRWGWGREWCEIPWWGFRNYLTLEEASARFGEKKANKLEYKNQVPTGDEGTDEASDRDMHDNTMKAEIWEFWRMADRTVHFWSKSAGVILDKKDDPLKLDGFWPIPKPMLANMTTSLFMPKADFTMTQDQYNEIDELNTRISMLTRAVKVVGVYDQGAGASVGRMMKEGVENDLIPVDNWAMFAEKGGLKGTIDWFPVGDIVSTLQTLRSVLSETISLLNQITGMSDILRGANTDQYVSDGTNKLTAQFGSIRIQALQDDFARFASDLESLKAEVISKHFDQTTIAKQSSAGFIPEADRDKIAPALELMKSPDVKWRINIKPESLSMMDYAQEKQEKIEGLTGLATLLQSAQPVIAAEPRAMPFVLEMIRWGMSGFKGSENMEGALDQALDMAKEAAENPQQQQDDGKAQEMQGKLQLEQMKQQLQQMKGQQDIQKIQIKSEADLRNTQAKIQGEIAKINADSQADQSLEAMTHRNDLDKINRELEAALTEVRANLSKEVEVERVQSQMAIAEDNVEHTNSIDLLLREASLALGGNNGANDG